LGIAKPRPHPEAVVGTDLFPVPLILERPGSIVRIDRAAVFRMSARVEAKLPGEYLEDP
jgi:hypothetical protein